MTFLILPVLALVITGSCDDGNICIEGNRQIETRILNNLAPFSGVILSGSANIEIVKDSEYGAVIRGESNIIRALEVEVRSGVLYIGSDQCLSPNESIDITLTTDALNRAELLGSGNIISLDPFSDTNLDLLVSGSGNIALIHDTEETRAVISGSGNITLQGMATTALFQISGSGNVAAFTYPVKECEVIVSGSGNCQVAVSDNLDVTISGSGNVFYKGNPFINTVISGSGTLINAN